VYHDEILNDLRRPTEQRLVSSLTKEEEEGDKKAGNGRYLIPRAGLFRYISFPNYLCEW
jgi:3-oxo-5-alpha-steroid 4-dehydrogenase 1